MFGRETSLFAFISKSISCERLESTVGISVREFSLKSDESKEGAVQKTSKEMGKTSQESNF